MSLPELIQLWHGKPLPPATVAHIVKVLGQFGPVPAKFAVAAPNHGIGSGLRFYNLECGAPLLTHFSDEDIEELGITIVSKAAVEDRGTLAIHKLIYESPLRVQRLSERALLPTRGSAFSAGLDLRTPEAAVVPAHGRVLVMTDLAFAIPEGHYGRIAPRSSLALRRSITVDGGVVDADYRGNVGVILVNHGDEEQRFEAGDAIAQLILETILMPPLQVAESLEDTERGAGGFGSTGR